MNNSDKTVVLILIVLTAEFLGSSQVFFALNPSLVDKPVPMQFVVFFGTFTLLLLALFMLIPKKEEDPLSAPTEFLSDPSVTPPNVNTDTSTNR